MNVRRGLVRILIVSVAAYWVVAAASAYRAYQDAPSPVAPREFVLRSQDGRLFGIQLPPDRPEAGCEESLPDIARRLRVESHAILSARACSDLEQNKALLVARHARAAMFRQLIGFAVVFAAILATLGGGWWIGRGFAPPSRASA